MSELEVTLGEADGAPVVALRGELDIATAPRVEEELRLVERDHPPVTVLDLRSLAFLDSSGLRLVIEADVRARAEGRRLVLVRGPAEVHRVFQVTMLDTRLEFVDDPAQITGAGSLQDAPGEGPRA